MTRATARSDSARPILLASYASFILIGWTGLSVPSLLPVLQDEFDRSDDPARRPKRSALQRTAPPS